MALRQHGWEARLHEWAEAAIGQPFVWGQTDCAILALEAWDALTGEMVAEEYVGAWDSEFGAAKFALENDIDIARKWRQLGAVDVAPGFQQRGDLIVCNPEAPVLMPRAHVCMGAEALSAAPETGVAWFACAALLAQPGVVILRCP